MTNTGVSSILYIPNKTWGINICVKLQEAHLADFKILLLSSERYKLNKTMIISQSCDFIFLQLNVKWLNHGIKYSHKIRILGIYVQ